MIGRQPKRNKKALSEYINDNTLSAVSLAAWKSKAGTEGPCCCQIRFSISVLLSSVKVQTLESKTVEEPISYEVDTVDDASLLSGETVVKSEGINGKALVDYKVSYVNGVETDKAIENITVVSEPVNAVVLRGTKERLSTGSYIWPTEGEITSDFGYRNVSVGSRNHKGIDIASDYGTPVYAADGGEVIMAEYYYGYGRFVKIKHDNGDITYYAHLSCINVSVGDKVGQGDMIGEMGCSGTATGTHLHFEYHPDGGDAADPITILPAR
jgi:murein DD-endopeptidase MepM/ murein hydrolase activator NlpD